MTDKFELPVIQIQTDSCCGNAATEPDKFIPDLDQSFVSGFVDTPAGRLPQVASALVWQDHRGTIRARLGAARMEYKNLTRPLRAGHVRTRTRLFLFPPTIR